MYIKFSICRKEAVTIKTASVSIKLRLEVLF
jgi:hypothetical protein